MRGTWWGLKGSLMQVPLFQQALETATSSLLTQVQAEIDPLQDVVDLIERAITADPPVSLSDGGMIADGYNAELDELRALSREGKGYIQNLQQEEMERTGISNLKVRFKQGVWVLFGGFKVTCE